MNSRKLFVMIMVMLMTFGASNALADCGKCDVKDCGGCTVATIGSEVAHSSMGGTTLNNTTAIFNAFPHLVIYNGNGVELDSECLAGSPSNYPDPFGRAWWQCKEDLWMILDVGRHDYGTRSSNFMWGNSRDMDGFSLMNYGNLPQGYEGTTHPWINIGVAKPHGAGAISANVFFGADSYRYLDTTDDNEYTDSSSGMGALFSWGNGSDLNVSAEVMKKSEKHEYLDPAAGGTDVVEDKDGFFSGALNVRKDTATRIFQGSVVFGSGSYEQYGDPAPDPVDTSVFGVYASAGKFLKNACDGQTSVELFASMGSQKESGTWNDGTNDHPWEEKDSMLAFPGVRVAAWEQISQHFGIMGAVYGAFMIDGYEETDDVDPEPDSDQTWKYHSYDWTAGMFWQPKSNVRVDIQFNKPEMGKIISLGNDDPLAMFIGATVGLN